MEINIRDLPPEMLDHIFSFAKPSLHNLVKYFTIQGGHSLARQMSCVRTVAVLRIQLAFGIKMTYLKLKKKITYQLTRMISMAPPITATPRGDCVYFAPHTPAPTAMCRFCGGQSHEHKISERLILKYYLPAVLPLFPDERYNH